MTITAPPHGGYDPYDYAIQDDPYPTYARLRENAPLYRNDEHGFWALSRHADVVRAFRDEARFSNQMGVSLDPASWGPHAKYAASFLAMDPPDQTRLRALVSRGFTPRRVQDLEPRIRALTCEYLDTALDGATVDFIEEFAGKLPMDVISELMGVPEADRAELRRLADLLVHRDAGLRDVPKAGLDAALTLFAYFADMIAQRRRAPSDDLTSALRRADVDGDRLTDAEIIGFVFLMIIAGNETTTKLLGNWPVLGHSQPRPAPRGAGRRVALVPAWIEETLRYDSSTQLLARYLLRTSNYTAAAPAGSQLVLLLGSANRDPEVFPDPDRYDLAATPRDGHLRRWAALLPRREPGAARGAGRLDELLARANRIEVDETAGIERVRSANVRGFAHLPVSFGAR